MPEGNDLDAEEVHTGWLTRALYLGLIGVNLYLLADWWATTPQGEAFVARWRQRLAEAKAKAAECEGCARRRELLGRGWTAAKNRMHWEAVEIVEEAAEQSEQP